MSKVRHVCKFCNKSMRAFSLIEVLASAFLSIVFLLLGVDVVLLIFGATVNDSACKDAVRAAAQGSTSTQSKQLFVAAMKAHRTDGTFITQPTETNFVYQDFGGNPPVDESPYVSGTTKVTVTLPAPIAFFGARFQNQFDFSQTYTFPIVRTKYLLRY